MKKIKNWLPHTLYILAVTIFFLYYLFPSDTLKDFITSTLNKTLPDINITINDIKPAFPPGLTLYKIDLYHQENLIFLMDKIRITPGLLSLIRPELTFFLKGKAYGGTIQGKLEIAKKELEPRVMIDGHLSGIQTQNISVLKKLTGRKLGGILGGRISYVNQKSSWGTLNAQLSLSDCIVELLTPVFNLTSFTFEKVDIEAVVNNQNVHVKQCVLKGTQMDGNISGSITLKQPWGKSIVRLGGTIKPHPSFLATLGKDLPAEVLPKKLFSKNGLPMRFSGTLDEPNFSF